MAALTPSKSSLADDAVLEEFTSDGEASGLEVERKGADGAILYPFDPEAIDVITQNRTIDLLLTRLHEQELDLSPEFQRRANLWTERQKSGLIESLLLRIPIPSLYVSEDKSGDYTVVDGLQRLCAIAHFADYAALNQAVNTKFDPLRLDGLESLTEYNGKSFDELPRKLQRRILETELTLHVIRAGTPPAVRFNIFSRINRGGLPLTAQEIRNAIFPGEWRDSVRSMSRSSHFIQATEGRIKGERMEDLELVLRFAAHYTLTAEGRVRPAEDNLDMFLNEFVENVSSTWPTSKWAELEAIFDRSMDAAPRVFGRMAFRKFSAPGAGRKPINRGLFESESVALAGRDDAELEVLAARCDQVVARFGHYFLTDAGFSNALLYATGRGNAAHKRLDVINKVFDEVIDA